MTNGICKILFPIIFAALAVWPASNAKAENGASSSSAVGALFSEEENAEVVLLRAHQYDAQAIIASVIGYAKGLGGFPRAPYLASAWNAELEKTGNFHDLNALSLMLLQQENVPWSTRYGASLVMCEQARQSVLLPLLKKQGLSDIEQYCTELEQEKKGAPEWEKDYAAAAKRLEEACNRQHDRLKAARDYRERPCSEESQAALFAAYDIEAISSLPFYAATSHTPDVQPPDWDAQRLLLFLNKVNECTQVGQGPPGQLDTAMAQKTDRIVSSVIDAMDTILHVNAEEAACTIRSAHTLFIETKKRDATRAMSRYYRNGAYGFIKNSRLSYAWAQHAAFGFDEASRLMLALGAYAEKDYALSWAWADTLNKSDEISEASKRIVSYLLAAIQNVAGADVIKEGAAIEARFYKESTAFGEWVRAQRIRRR